MPYVFKPEVDATLVERSEVPAGPRAPKVDVAEGECIRRAQGGDVSAYEELVRKHQKRVMAIVGGILRWRDDMEDVAQQVFLKVYLALKRFDGRSSFATWLYKITVNETYDHLRKKRARKLLYESDLSEEQQEQMRRTRRTGTGGAPEPHVLERMEARQVADALLAELGVEDRAMLLLKEVEGFSVEEIGEMLGQNVNTVKVRMFRARRRLAEIHRKRFGARGLRSGLAPGSENR
jgi:RNA polymerase sigma-70 factor (ECF subfamily)